MGSEACGPVGECLVEGRTRGGRGKAVDIRRGEW
ncbi:hypothetical protein E2C01_097929 [Portunus trituberculatus]|uniref:Uncharacterized protein n=1 Tax=Portunus trituberculatus TaxID=210409 RepID=A0A5B7JZW8_PORTR|nr:hypothetical protein [Portunus trituberculatus]